MPPQSVERVRKRFIFETREGLYCLVVCAGEGRTRKVAENPRGYAKNIPNVTVGKCLVELRAETLQGSALR